MKLNKPYRTPKGPKKFAVHVKDEQGKTKKVNFGDPNSEIKRDDPKRRAAFRSRHGCESPGAKTKARYWSCLMWGKKPVKKIVGESDMSEPKWVRDEGVWDRAKKAARKAQPDDLYALTTYLYKKMGGRIAAKEADRTGIRTTHWFYGTEAFIKKDLEAKPQLLDDVKPTPEAELAARKILIENPNIPAATLLNTLKAQGIELVDQKPQLQADSTSSQTAVLKSFRKTESGFKFFTAAQFLEAASDKNAGVGPIRFKVALIQEGLGNLKDAFFYSKDAIHSGIQAFEGRKCFADHPSSTEERDRPERSVRDIIGHFENVRVEENEDGSAALVADLVMPPDPPFEWARSLVREAARYNQKYPEQSLVGLSINASGDASEIPFDEFLKEYKLPDSCKPKLMKAREAGMQNVKVVSSIKDAVSCDLVTEPGARGAIIEILESETQKEKKEMKKEMEKKPKIEKEEEKKMMMSEEEEEKKAHPASESEEEKKEADGDEEDHEDIEKDKKLIIDMIKKYMGEEDMESEAEEAAMEAYEAYKSMGESEDEAMKCAGKAMKLAKHMAEKKESEMEKACESEEEGEEEKVAPKKESSVKLEARIAFLERELKKRELADFLDSQLKESGLGRAETDKIRKIVGAPKSESEITKTIKIFKEAFEGRSESAPKSGFFINLEKVSAPVKRSKVSFGDCI